MTQQRTEPVQFGKRWGHVVSRNQVEVPDVGTVDVVGVQLHDGSLRFGEEGGDDRRHRVAVGRWAVRRSQGQRIITLPWCRTMMNGLAHAHAFVNEQSARTGVFGMEDGKRVMLELDPETGFPLGLSHRWPAAKMVALLLGKQEDQ